ncbi:MAG: TerB N-terminal domain-containing protein [Planctomycetes bacterium]|nr:TerB N-terminal domain-containing protein [Planctomycetota bacterium]
MQSISVWTKIKCFIKAIFFGWFVILLGALFILYIWKLTGPANWLFSIVSVIIYLSCFLLPIWIYKYLSNQVLKGDSFKSSRSSSSVYANKGYEHKPTGVSYSISISPNRTQQQKGTSKLEWKGKGTVIQLGQYLIKNPFTYYSKGNPPEEEPSCINLRLRIGEPIVEPKGSMGYWPYYGRITPNQRANYLSWLSSGKGSELEDIGYAFIYFYGLERRVIVEEQDILDIASEVAKLLQEFTHSNSFNNYLGNFLAYIIAKYGIEKIPEEIFKTIFGGNVKISNSDYLSVAVAWFITHNQPLPVYWAQMIAKFDSRSPHSVITKRAPKNFNELFTKKYHDKFGKGFIPEFSKRNKDISYQPASGALLGAVSPHVKIPNAFGSQRQYSPLVEIWSSSIEELKQFSRVVGEGKSKSSREAYEALPETLKEETEHPDTEKWTKLFFDHTKDDGTTLVPSSKLAELKELPYKEKLTLQQCKSLAQTAQYIGIGMEPDPRITNTAYRWEENISLYKPDEVKLPTDSTYIGVSVIFELGMVIAASDGVIQSEEVDFITKFIEGYFQLSIHDSNRLEALKSLLIEYPPDLSRNMRKLKKYLKKDQREKVGEFLVGIAASYGSIGKAEIKALERAYKILDIPEGRLDEFIGNLRRDFTAPVSISQDETKKRTSEAIPQRETKHEIEQVHLDHNRIRELLMQTQEVAPMIGDAMGNAIVDERDEDTIDKKQTPVKKPSSAQFTGLDARYHDILEKLLELKSCPKDSFESIALKHNLMPSAIIEVINEWSDITLGDLLIEEGDPIIINHKLMDDYYANQN